MTMLPSNTATAAADSGSRAATYEAVNGTVEVNGESGVVNGSTSGDATCHTPVTDPDSLALLAAMCEANRSTGQSLCVQVLCAMRQKKGIDFLLYAFF